MYICSFECSYCRWSQLHSSHHLTYGLRGSSQSNGYLTNCKISSFKVMSMISKVYASKSSLTLCRSSFPQGWWWHSSRRFISSCVYFHAFFNEFYWDLSSIFECASRQIHFKAYYGSSCFILPRKFKNIQGLFNKFDLIE